MAPTSAGRPACRYPASVRSVCCYTTSWDLTRSRKSHSRLADPSATCRTRGQSPICCSHASAREGSMLPAGVLRSTPELTVMTEAGLAALRREDGIRVQTSVGRQWGEIFRGFYQPIHLLARLRRAEIRRPTLACWGYRAALTDEDAGSANASMPVHLLSDVGHFTEAALDRNRTRDLRKCRQEVEIRRERDPALLVDQGYAVFMSAQRRTDFYSRPATEAEFRLRMEQQVSEARRGPGRRLEFLRAAFCASLAGGLSISPPDEAESG